MHPGGPTGGPSPVFPGPMMPALPAFVAAFQRLPGASRGGLLMLLSGAAFAVMMALVRLVADDIHPFEAAFFRNLFGLLFMLPWVAVAGLAPLRSGRWRVHLLRSAFGLAAMLSLFLALTLLPLAEATALSFTSPLFATIGAALVLRETVRLRRWLATLVGFLGALIVLRPGATAFDPSSLVALTAALFIAGAMLSIKSLSRTEHPNAIVVMMGLWMTPASLVPALFVWRWPTPETWGWLLLIGFSATIGQVCLTRAFACAEASAVLPYDFFRLIFTAGLGYLIFGQIPDAWTLVGGLVILAASVYIARREAVLARRTAPPPTVG